MLGNFNIRAANNSDKETVVQLITKVLNEYGLKIDPLGVDRDVEDIETNYFERGGLFEIVEDSGGIAVGTVGLYPIDKDVCELRKMYLLPEVRGQGLGKMLLERMLRKTRDLGFAKMELETASVLKEAIALYTKYGFKPVKTGDLAARCDQRYELVL